MQKNIDREEDHVDRVRKMWAQQMPSLDTSPMAIVARMGRASRFFDVQVEAVLNNYGLSRESWDILASLRRSGPPYRLSPTDLFRGLMRTSGAITFRLRRLENAGLIVRVRNNMDNRGKLVELTPKGLQLVNTVAPVHMKNESRIISVLTKDEQKLLADLLRKLLLSFESSGRKPPIEKEWWSDDKKVN